MEFTTLYKVWAGVQDGNDFIKEDFVGYFESIESVKEEKREHHWLNMLLIKVQVLVDKKERRVWKVNEIDQSDLHITNWDPLFPPDLDVTII